MSDLENLEILLDRMTTAISGIEHTLADVSKSIMQQQSAIAQISLRVAELERIVGTKKTYTIEEACRVVGISRSLAYKRPGLLPKPITRDPLRFSIDDVQAFVKGRSA